MQRRVFRTEDAPGDVRHCARRETHFGVFGRNGVNALGRRVVFIRENLGSKHATVRRHANERLRARSIVTLLLLSRADQRRGDVAHARVIRRSRVDRIEQTLFVRRRCRARIVAFGAWMKKSGKAVGGVVRRGEQTRRALARRPPLLARRFDFFFTIRVDGDAHVAAVVRDVRRQRVEREVLESTRLHGK